MGSLNSATEPNVQASEHSFTERRQVFGEHKGVERRQFASSYSELSSEGAELGEAVDRYKMSNRRRFVTYDEILAVVKSLGYSRPDF